KRNWSFRLPYNPPVIIVFARDCTNPDAPRVRVTRCHYCPAQPILDLLVSDSRSFWRFPILFDQTHFSVVPCIPIKSLRSGSPIQNVGSGYITSRLICG